MAKTSRATKATRSAHRGFCWRFLVPYYWPIWILVGLLWLLGKLPYASRFRLGAWLGRKMYRLAGSRRRLALANLTIAFPNLSPDARADMALRHFESFGIAIMETTFVWWGRHRRESDPKRNERQHVRYIGLEHLHAAQAKGKGVLVLAPHFTHLDVTTLFISLVTDLYPVYRPNDNPVLEYVMTSGRTVGTEPNHIHYQDTRAIVKALKQGKSLGYLPDQRYRGKGHLKVPFFGRDAKSHSATSKLAKMTGCAVVPTFTRRVGTEYEVYFYPALDGFPSGDDFADTARLHALYEAEINQNPSQYLWVHNRWDLSKREISSLLNQSV